MARSRKSFAIALALLALAAASLTSPAALVADHHEEAPKIRRVELPSPGSPLVAIRLQFDVGSIDDPKGKEGLAALTADMLGTASTAKRSYTELIDALYPMAASINVQTDREVTIISGEVHRDTLAEFTTLLTEALTKPGFVQADFERNKQQLSAFLETTLRSSSDELLGLEMLQQEIFAGHPYGHSPAGTVKGLAAITLDDVKAFYRSHFTPDRLTLGLAGGYPESYPDQLAAALDGLPKDGVKRPALPKPAKAEGRSFTLVDKQTASVGIHFGYALPITRADADYYPLMVANSYLGEHRTFFGRLMQQLRGNRGLNYGDYSYIEHYYNPPFTSNPTPGVPRQQQYFSVWIRPVVPDTAQFALRNALFEVDRLLEKGMTEEEFALQRDFLLNYSKLWAQTLERRLGFLMDSEFYGAPYFIDEIDRRLKAMTKDEVVAAARKYLSTDDYLAVMITADGDEFAKTLKKDAPSPMTYQSEPTEEVARDDKTIEKLPVKPTAMRVVPVAEVLEE